MADPLCKACSGTGMFVGVLGTRGFCDCTKATPMPQVYITQAPGGTSYGKKLNMTMLKSRGPESKPMHVAEGVMDALNFNDHMDAATEFEKEVAEALRIPPLSTTASTPASHAMSLTGVVDGTLTFQNSWSDQPTTPETPADWDKAIEMLKLFAKKHPVGPPDFAPSFIERSQDLAKAHQLTSSELEKLRSLLAAQQQKEERKRMQNCPLVTHFVTEYRDRGDSYGGIGPKVSRFSGSGEVVVKVEMILPPNADPNELLNRLKDPDMWAGGAPPSRPEYGVGVSHYKEEVKRLTKLVQEKEVQANEIARTLVSRDTEIAKLKQTAINHPDTEALLTLRKRMNIAIQAIEDAGLARELYEEVVREWSHTIQEGASFTQAEGDDLVERLVQFIQYIDTARATKKSEKKPAVKPTSKKKDQLF